MTIKHERAVGDTLTPFKVQMLNEDGSVMNLTGKTVQFSMFDADGMLLVPRSPATIINAVNGEVQYDFQTSDVVTANASTEEAPNKGYFHATLAGETETWPPDGIAIIIHDPAVDTTPTPSIDIIELANAPKRTRTEEGTVEERTIDELIKADQYATAKSANVVPWGIRVARIKPGSTTPGA